MKKTISFLAFAFSVCAANAGQEASYLQQAGLLYRANKLCGSPIEKADLYVIADVMLASSVNPRLSQLEGPSESILAALRSPSASQLEDVKNETNLYQMTVNILDAKIRMIETTIKGRF